MNRTYPMGDDPATATNGSQPATSIDLRRVQFGSATFANPCFWLLVGIIGTIAAQYFLKRMANKN